MANRDSGSRAVARTTDDANHRAALALARRERSLAIQHEEHESDALAAADNHDVFGRLTVRMSNNAVEVRRRLENMVETEEELAAIRPFAETYVQLSVEAQRSHGRRMLS